MQFTVVLRDTYILFLISKPKTKRLIYAIDKIQYNNNNKKRKTNKQQPRSYSINNSL